MEKLRKQQFILSFFLSFSEDYNQNIRILHFCVGEIQAGRVNLELTHPSDGKNIVIILVFNNDYFSVFTL